MARRMKIVYDFVKEASIAVSAIFKCLIIS